eukprot:m.81309 g.81309  ORF g.81309 m.81309 type:complete len:71 (-) comp14244_c0_seq2:2425-2637(-)
MPESCFLVSWLSWGGLVLYCVSKHGSSGMMSAFRSGSAGRHLLAAPPPLATMKTMLMLSKHDVYRGGQHT